MTPGHVLTSSRSHALARAGMLARLADRLRVRGGLPGPDLDLQDHGDGMDITEALDALAPLPAPVPLAFPGPHGPLVRDAIGIRPATAGEIAAAREALGTAPSGPPWTGASVTAGNPLPPLDRRYVPAPPSEVIALVPLTEPARIFDQIGGEARIARPCSHCGEPWKRTDFSWRYDALGGWSCPLCQMRPDWHSPLLPGVLSATKADDAETYGEPESGIIARSRLATDPRCVRERPDGRWGAAILIGGRRKVLGSFSSKEQAEGVYGAILDAFAAAAGPRAA